MSANSLENAEAALAGAGMGILAADASPGTLAKRFTAWNAESTPESRRA